jgi:hypothetical protein
LGSETNINYKAKEDESNIIIIQQKVEQTKHTRFQFPCFSKNLTLLEGTNQTNKNNNKLQPKFTAD